LPSVLYVALYKRCSSNFDLGPLMPKIYSGKFCTKSPISRLVWQIDQRCLGIPGGFWGWLIQWNHAKCCGAAPCCHGNEIWARHGDLDAYQLVYIVACQCCRGENILLFLVQTVGRQLVEQRQYRPPRVRSSGGTARKHVNTAELGR